MKQRRHLRFLADIRLNSQGMAARLFYFVDHDIRVVSGMGEIYHHIGPGQRQSLCDSGAYSGAAARHDSRLSCQKMPANHIFHAFLPGLFSCLVGSFISSSHEFKCAIL